MYLPKLPMSFVFFYEMLAHKTKVSLTSSQFREAQFIVQKKTEKKPHFFCSNDMGTVVKTMMFCCRLEHYFLKA